MPRDVLLTAMMLLSGARPAAAQGTPGGGATPPPGRTQALDRVLQDLADCALAAPEREVLMLWVVDASNSMVDDLAHIAKRLDDFFRKVEGRKVLHMGVVAFDDKPRTVAGFLKRSDSVRKAIGAVGVSGKGIENCMAAVEEGARVFPKKRTYYGMIVLMTDERGDDEKRVEETIRAVRDAGAHVYVIGREAPFGWSHAYEPDPAKGFNVTVQAGPESAGFETLQMSPLCCRQWFPGCRKALARRHDDGREMGGFESFFQKSDPLRCDLGYDQSVASGFGCWAQARLAAETGGRYFLIRDQPGAPEGALMGYEPELCSREEWTKRNREGPLRKAVMEVLDALDAGGAFGLVNADTQDIRVMRKEAGALREKAQDLEKRLQEWMDALDRARPDVATGAAAPVSKRWTAHRDLLAAQLAVLSHGVEQYRLMLAEDPIPDKIVGLEMRGVIRGDGARQRAARERLDAVIRDHPDTPWAKTAALLKERLHGFSLREVNYGGRAPKKGSK